MSNLTTSTDVDTFMGSANQAAMRTNMSLGTAATADSTDFATAAQGSLANSAVQPGDLGTAAYSDTTAFATAAQGTLADSSIQGTVGTTDNRLVRADGTGGKTLQATGVAIDDSDNVTGVDSISAKGSGGLVLKTSGGATVATFGAGGTTVTLPSGTNIGSVSGTEIGYLDGVTSGIQGQLDAKASSSAAITIAGNSTALGGSVTQDQITGLSTTGLVKRTASNTLAIAASGTDYAPATSGSAILKGNGSGGFSNAASGTDYAPATSGSAILKGNGAGGFSSAAAGTDYAPAPSGSSVLKANGSGGFSNAVAGTDFCGATSGSGMLKASSGNTATASAGTDYVAPGATTTSGLTMATARLLGRTTASTGAIEEITVGTGLSLSGGSLTATGGNGKILQVIQATKTDTASVTGTTFTSLFSASITPSSSSSTVLVLVTLNVGGATNNWPLIRLTRSSTTLLQGDAASNRVRVTTVCGAPNSATSTSAAISYLDSPASTSALTYNIEVASQSTGTIYLNRSVTDTDTTAFQRGASTIILMEVAA